MPAPINADASVRPPQWSKAVYAYAVAALLVQLGGEANQAEGLRLMTDVPKLRQRIAGKSIPLEKFVARKARKCEAQRGRLVLPALEFAYILHAVLRAPRAVVAAQMLPLVEAALAELGDSAGAGGSGEFWDDWCLARHLEGACLRYIAYPVRSLLFFVFLTFVDTVVVSRGVGTGCARGSERGPDDFSGGSCAACVRRVPVRV
jgi:hypothetical protein